MQPAIVKLFATVLALVGPAPADSPKEFQLKSGDKIVTIGDSITAEGGVRESGFLRRIDAVLAKQYPDKKFPEVINAGRGGQRSEHLVPRFDDDVMKHKPAHVVIAIGINDVWQRLSEADGNTAACRREDVGGVQEERHHDGRCGAKGRHQSHSADPHRHQRGPHDGRQQADAHVRRGRKTDRRREEVSACRYARHVPDGLEAEAGRLKDKTG